VEVPARGFQGYQGAAAEGVQQGDLRQTADAQSGLHAAFDGLGVLQFHQHLHSRQQSVHRPVEGLAGAGTLLPENPHRVQQALFRQARPPGVGVSWGTKHHQVVLPPAGDIQVRVVDLPLDKAHVQLEVADHLDDMGGVGNFQFDVGARVFRHVAGDKPGHQVVADAQGGPHLEGAAGGGVGVGVNIEQVLQLPRPLQQLLRLGLYQPAELVEQQFFPRPVEQLNIELAFELLEGAAGGGLGHGQLVGGTADIFRVGGGDKDFELAQAVFHIGIVDYKYSYYPFYLYKGPRL